MWRFERKTIKPNPTLNVCICALVKPQRRLTKLKIQQGFSFQTKMCSTKYTLQILNRSHVQNSYVVNIE